MLILCGFIFAIERSDCPNVVMLSSTSLLHGNCVFNRNNTVATQQGMKTYWLCKSYRISMCRARCITHQGKIISATGVHNHPPHMRGNNASGSGATGGNGSHSGGGGGNSGNHGNSSNNGGPLPSSQAGNNSGLSTSSSSNMMGLRFPQNTGPSGNITHQNYHEQHHSTASPPPTAAFSTNPHMHPSSSGNSNMPPHLFLQSMPNLLVQHHPGSQSTQLMHESLPPAQNNVVQHMMHSGGMHHSPQTHSNFEISPVMQSSPSEHSRNTNSTFDPHEKSLNALQKDHLNDDHVTIHNAALSPSEMHNKAGPVNALTHDNEINAKISSSEHHQVQVIDSITISPSSGHNFKMESL